MAKVKTLKKQNEYEQGQLVDMYHILIACVKQYDTKGADPNVSYCIAKNIKDLKKIVEDFDAEDAIRLKSYCEKDDQGDPLVEPIEGSENSSYIFLNDEAKATAVEKYKELRSKPIKHEFFTIKNCAGTKKIHPLFQVELLDLIIIQ